jgi:NADP-dependent 3-hydroxy acid dehydrogenase YdfG
MMSFTAKYLAVWPRIAVGLGFLSMAVHYISRVEFAVPLPASSAVVVTGASSGIGRHAAVELAMKGFVVFAGVRKQADADRLRAAAVKAGYNHKMKPLILDVTNRTSIDLAAAEVRREIKNLNVGLFGLVNNAGVSRDLPLELQPDENIRFVYEVNVFGVMAVSRTFIPMLREAGSGSRIVNIGSVAGLFGTAKRSTYSGSKFALEGLTEATRLELRKWYVRPCRRFSAFDHLHVSPQRILVGASRSALSTQPTLRHPLEKSLWLSSRQRRC